MERNWGMECLTTSVIVRKILAHFSNQDLLPFSLVNKTWNIETKSLLKVRGRTCLRLGTIKPEELVHSVDSISDTLREAARKKESGNVFENIEANACEDAMNFADLIESMAVIPFSKLEIQITNDHSGSCVSFAERAFRKIIEAVALTSLKFSIFTNPGCTRDRCYALRLLKLLLVANAHQLREIIIGAPTELSLHAGNMPITYNFGQLRVLIFDLCDLPRRPSLPEMLFLKSIVVKAPNLQYLELQQSLENHPRDLSENKIDSRLVQNLFRVVLSDSQAAGLVLPQDPVDPWKLSKHFLNRLAVRYLDALPDSTDRAELDARTVLLKNSSWTLSEADLDILSLTTSLRHQIRFPHMQQLSVEYNTLDLLNEYWLLRNEILQTWRWSQCFPNLRKLVLYEISEEYDEFLLDELQDQLRNVMENHVGSKEGTKNCRLYNVQDLTIGGSNLQITEREFLCNLCPNVKRFTARATPFHFTGCWSSLTRIEFMKLIPIATNDENMEFDCILCGVSPAELKELQGKDAEILKKLHIIPRGTPITHLKHLTTVEFHFRDLPSENGEQCYGSSFSKVSAGLAFSRMPNLSISIRLSKPMSSNGDEHGYETILNDFPELSLSVQVVYDDDAE